jgi:hypothetical protein
MIETETGWFIQGAYFEGVRPDMIGKRIVHVGRVMAPWGAWDGSGCTIHGIGISNANPRGVILHEILPDNSIMVELNPDMFPGSVSMLPKEWNTGKWIEVKP